MQGPLSGVRVLDFTRVLAGPHATLMLADMGAEVIKIEPPAGDVTRFQYPRRNSLATYFAQQNIGKRCMSIDLSQPAGVELALALVEHCDVLVENYRAGVMDRIGLGYDTVQQRNPNIIYASVSGYGQTGPWVKRRAYAPVVGAEAGLTKSQGDQRGGAYQNDRHSHADAYTALEVSVAICASLFRRERDGVGDRIDVSMAETLLYVNEHVNNDLWDGDVGDDWIRSFGNEHHPVVEVGNGEWAIIAAHPAMKGVFEPMFTAIGRADLLDDERFATQAARLKNFAELNAILAEFCQRQPEVAALEAVFDKIPASAGSIAVGQLRSVRDIAQSDWAAQRKVTRTVSDRGDGQFRLPNVPWRFTQHPDVGTRADPPEYRGESNAAVLRDVLGYDDEMIEALQAAAILSDHLPKDYAGT